MNDIVNNNCVLDFENKPWLKTYQLLNICNQLPQIKATSFANIIEKHAKYRPDFDALIYLGHSISYLQLNDYSNRFANLLKEQGIKKGDVLGIYLPNSPQWVVALVAASKLGCIVSGISPLLSNSEIIYQINDAKIKVLLTFDQLYNEHIIAIEESISCLEAVFVSGAVDFLPTWKKSVASWTKKIPQIKLTPMKNILVFSFWEQLIKTSNHRVYCKIELNDTIYIQYTGGTTGRAKGVELSLHSIQCNILQTEAFLMPCDKNKNETVASVFPLFHIGGLSFLIATMQHAVRYLLVPDPRNLKQFCKEMKTYPPSIMANIPALYQILTKYPAFRKLDFSKLRYALSGASAFPIDGINLLEEIIGHNKLCEVYGMTEASPVITCNPAKRPKKGTVGIPVLGTEIKIISPHHHDREMPLTEAGEIIVSGFQIMEGYFNRPDETNQALREFDGKLWFFTGDIGKLDEEGYLSLCDRYKDTLIVGNGYEVYSVEVENELKQLDFIAQCALIGVPDLNRPGKETINLYVQLAPEALKKHHREIKQKILNFCMENMPTYKIPKNIYIIERIPLTAIGKVDKKALRVQKT